MTALKKWIMAKNFEGVIGLPTSSTFIIASPLPEMHLQKVERHEATDRLSCSTVVFLLNELFVTRSCRRYS